MWNILINAVWNNYILVWNIFCIAVEHYVEQFHCAEQHNIKYNKQYNINYNILYNILFQTFAGNYCSSCGSCRTFSALILLLTCKNVKTASLKNAVNAFYNAASVGMGLHFWRRSRLPDQAQLILLTLPTNLDKLTINTQQN